MNMNVTIKVALPLKLLNDVQKNISGKSRAEKLRKCIQVGYEELASKLVREGDTTPFFNEESQMKVQISKNVYDQLKKLVENNRIAIASLANVLLGKMLNHHHKEIKQLIQQMKKGETENVS